MHPHASSVAGSNPAVPHSSPATDTLDRVLHHARRLHRAARSASISAAMPVVRRIHAAGLFPHLRVAGLYRARASLQRKHVLRMLAVEAGHASWEAYRDVLPGLSPEAVSPWHVAERLSAGLNLWFPNEAEARAALGDAVTLLKYGHQVVVDGEQAERVLARNRGHLGSFAFEVAPGMLDVMEARFEPPQPDESVECVSG